MTLPPLDPTSERFWSAEDVLLMAALRELALAIYLYGAQQGTALMPAGLRLLIDSEFINEAAIAFLRMYQLGPIASVNGTTRRLAVDAIEQWVWSGEPLPSLLKSLTPLFGAERAEVIGVTEVTRIYSEGNIASWRSTGTVGGKKWFTARDERVCPLCSPLHGKVVSIDAEYDLSADEIAGNPAMRALVTGKDGAERRQNRAQSLLKQVANTRQYNRGMGINGIQGPPLHPRCRCEVKPVVDLGLVERQFSQFGIGDRFDLMAAELRGRVDLFVMGG